MKRSTNSVLPIDQFQAAAAIRRALAQALAAAENLERPTGERAGTACDVLLRSIDVALSALQVVDDDLAASTRSARRAA